MKANEKIFFCGIGGSGMSAIAQIIAQSGVPVAGSDRNFDQGKCLEQKNILTNMGIKIYPQDGSGPKDHATMLVTSTAVEETIPDVKASLELQLPIKRRAAFLAELFNEKKGLAIGGTSGKSTVTGMVGWIFAHAGLDPKIINGGVMENFKSSDCLGNAYVGRSDWMIIESDESDGTLVYYQPLASIITNITLDHKPLEELREIFETFIMNTKQHVVINIDDEESKKLYQKYIKKCRTFSLTDASADYFADQIQLNATDSKFQIKNIVFTVPVPGLHNVANALASVALANSCGIPLDQCAEAISSFKGIGRRFQKIGCVNDITVFDDFGHNPEKIEATLRTIIPYMKESQRLLVMYQSHGFAPTKLLKDGFIQVFSNELRAQDYLLMPEIFYAGGTVTRNISSNDITSAVSQQGKQALFFQNREEIKKWLLTNAKAGDTIMIMGARDDTLTDFAKNILKELQP